MSLVILLLTVFACFASLNVVNAAGDPQFYTGVATSLQWSSESISTISTEVNLQNYNFPGVPVFIARLTTLRSQLWTDYFTYVNATGTTIAKPTSSGFRMRLASSDGKPLTQTGAKGLNFQVNWVAVLPKHPIVKNKSGIPALVEILKEYLVNENKDFVRALLGAEYQLMQSKIPKPRPTTTTTASKANATDASSSDTNGQQDKKKKSADEKNAEKKTE